MKTKKKFTRLLNEFISSSANRSWLKTREVEVYVRKSCRIHGQRGFTCLDLASISVVESERGKGIFKDVLAILQEKVEDSTRFHAVYIENVLEPRLKSWLDNKVKGGDAYHWREFTLKIQGVDHCYLWVKE